MHLRSTSCVALGGAALAALLTSSAPASATIGWATNNPPVLMSSGNHHEIDNAISRADCLDGGSIEYVMTTDNTVNTVEVWASTDGGADCTDPTIQAASCTQVRAGETLTELEFTSTLTLAEIVGAVDDADAAACTRTSSAEITVYLYFIEYNGGTIVTSLPATQLIVDLLGPPAPTLTSVDRGGSGTLELVTSDLTDEAEGLLGFCSLADSGGSGGGGSESCSASDLTPGEVPSGEADGSSADSNSVLVTDLVDDELHACGAAARDRLNNPGPLSELLCNTPVPAIGFTPAENCFCAAPGGNNGGNSVGLWAALGLLGSLLLRRKGSA